MTRSLSHAALGTLVIVLVAPLTARAQADGSSPPVINQGASEYKNFLALDVFGGFLGQGGSGTEGNAAQAENKWSGRGWEIGGTARFRPWLGVAGSVAGQSWNDTKFQHYLVGPRVSSSYGGYQGVRGFVHTLIGRVNGRRSDGSSDSGTELVIGGGVDVYYMMRLQFDYVRSGLDDLPKNQFRFFIGGVVPFCFRGCRPDDIDGLNFSRRRP